MWKISSELLSIAVSIFIVGCELPNVSRSAPSDKGNSPTPSTTVLSVIPKVIEPGPVDPTVNLNYPRALHSAVALNDERVLVVGGYGQHPGDLPSEIYDPTLRKFGLAGALNTSRVDATATLMTDGRV